MQNDLLACVGAGADAAGAFCHGAGAADELGQGGMRGRFIGEKFPVPVGKTVTPFGGGVLILAWKVSEVAACAAFCAGALDAAFSNIFPKFPCHEFPSPRIGLIDSPVIS